jgi:MYXO-CTERM domain-containing protein
MRQSIVLGSSALSVLLLAASANAADWYVSPTGTATTGCTTRSNPCSLSAATGAAVAGDNVILMDGVYQEQLYVANSGTSSAWITIKADQCATPIIEGEGVGPNDDNQDNGVHSTTAEYVKFIGIVSRGWNIGFGNGWAGGVDSDEVSNGHWEIEYCAAYSNGRTGFTFFSAEGFKLKNSISAHNGSSEVQSWSSGVTLFEATGTNLVEGNISFENTEFQQNTDGSGFIVDEESNGVTFINNLAFRNAGSCLRLTRSSGTKFINNTCYHNSQFGSTATGPTNPGEIYFTNGGVTQQGVSFMNNVIVGTGVAPAGNTPIQNQPSSGWTNNVVTTGSVNYFTGPTATNPNFVPAAAATNLIGAGSAGTGVPTNDVGFDPKCIVKQTPVMVGQVARASWWEYDIDIEYIKSIGGVAKCFNPATRSGTPDIGAYKAGAVATAPACEPPVIGTGGAGGMGGAAGASGMAGAGGVAAGAGGVAGAAGSAGDAAGGVPAAGGMAGVGGDPAAGGAAGMAGLGAGGVPAAGAAGGAGVAGTMTATGGSAGAVGTAGSAGAAVNTGGAPVSAGGSAGSGTAAGGAGGSQPPVPEEPGCNCRMVPQRGNGPSLAALGFLGLAALLFQRRRQAR